MFVPLRVLHLIIELDSYTSMLLMNFQHPELAKLSILQASVCNVGSSVSCSESSK
jgi:hypothetical protein